MIEQRIHLKIIILIKKFRQNRKTSKRFKNNFSKYRCKKKKKKYYSGPFRKININSKLQIINKKLKFHFSIFYKIYYILNFFIRSYRFAKNKINKVFNLI